MFFTIFGDISGDDPRGLGVQSRAVLRKKYPWGHGENSKERPEFAYLMARSE